MPEQVFKAIAFKTDRDADLIAHIQRQDNFSRYVRDLIRRDLKGDWGNTSELRGLVATMIEQAIQGRKEPVSTVNLPATRGMLG